MPTQHRSGDSNGLAAEDRSDKKHKKPYYPPYYSGPKTYTVPKVTVQLNVSPEKTFKFAADDVSLAPINAGHSTVLTASLVKPGHREVKKVAPVPLDVSKVVPELLKLFGVFAGKKPYSHYWSAVDIFWYNWSSLIHSFFAIIKLIHLRGKWGNNAPGGSPVYLTIVALSGKSWTRAKFNWIDFHWVQMRSITSAALQLADSISTTARPANLFQTQTKG